MRVEVETAHGKLVGQQYDGHQAYRGIPYAAPPTGDRRFRAPAPVEPWSGVREALAFGNSAPQPIHGGVLPVGPQDEDCLFLNVYTPAANAGKRPVMCYFHGGAFFLGSSAEATYNGGPLVERGDVVVVTVNYRLGALGFLYLGDHGGAEWGATSNAGMLDQVAALRWVRDNIAAFGGDPQAVTIFGQSAGAFSVCTLLAMPQAKGLFRHAIAQSGHASLGCSKETATDTADTWLKALELTEADPAVLRALPLERILQAQHAARANDIHKLAPTVDGEVLPAPPIEAVHAGNAGGIPLLLGTTRDEMNLFTNPRRDEIDEATLLRCAARILQATSESRVREAVAIYRSSRRSRGLPHGNNDIVDALTTATRFRIEALRLAETQHAHQSQTFMYEFTWPSPARRGTLGAVHALELPFVFGMLGRAIERLTGPPTPAMIALSERMMNAWIAFARTGDPNCASLEPWPAYDPGTRPTMTFDLDTRVVNAPLDEERAVWADMQA